MKLDHIGGRYIPHQLGCTSGKDPENRGSRSTSSAWMVSECFLSRKPGPLTGEVLLAASTLPYPCSRRQRAKIRLGFGHPLIFCTQAFH
jgi:hypothetical protein